MILERQFALQPCGALGPLRFDDTRRRAWLRFLNLKKLGNRTTIVAQSIAWVTEITCRRWMRQTTVIYRQWMERVGKSWMSRQRPHILRTHRTRSEKMILAPWHCRHVAKVRNWASNQTVRSFHSPHVAIMRLFRLGLSSQSRWWFPLMNTCRFVITSFVTCTAAHPTKSLLLVQNMVRPLSWPEERQGWVYRLRVTICLSSSAIQQLRTCSAVVVLGRWAFLAEHGQTFLFSSLCFGHFPTAAQRSPCRVSAFLFAAF